MDYKNESDNPVSFISTANLAGYDVILVNQPTYFRNGVKIDGGADFIERNAMNLATLINKLNVKLTENGSTEKLVVIGPSMGGQISRYALAWMEKKFAETNDAKYKHNTRIWVSFDSPNLGANVPLGDQALINLLKSESADAEKKYIELLGSTASKQQLIEFHAEGATKNSINSSYLNGSTVSQGMPTNSGNPFFQSHYNNQFSNGLAGSKGFPMNLRKLAIVNGSLTGKTTGTNQQTILEIKGIQKICHKPFSFFGFGGGPSICFDNILTEIIARNMPQNVGTSQIAYFRKVPNAGNGVSTTNLNFRGNMDIVPGGIVGSTNDISTSVTGSRLFPTRGSFWQYTSDNLLYWLSNTLGSARWEVRQLVPNHSFIPTFSALGIKNPYQSWANSLNRNLVCTGETYFDSYYGEAENTEHVKLNFNSVNWLIKELGTSTTPPIAQSPNFPIQQSLPVGASTICINSNTTYNLDACMVPSEATWSTTSGLQIISSTGYNVTVRGLVAGYVSLIATFQNGQKLTRSIQVSGSAVVVTNPGRVVGNPTINLNEASAFNYEGGANGVTNYRWFIYGGINDGQGPDGGAYITRGQGTTFIELENGSIVGTLIIEVKALNACDEVIDSAYMFVEVTNPMARFAATSSSYTISTFPNPLPASNELQVNVVQTTTATTTVATATKATAIATDNQVKIYDFYGNLKYSSRFKTDNMSLKNLNLKEGNYILNVITTSGEQLRTILFVK